MKKKFKSILKKDMYVDESKNAHVIMVYGELEEDEVREGIAIARVKSSRDGKILMGEPVLETIIDNESGVYGSEKRFNMGWAICSEADMDKFSDEEGIRICKKRFAKSPLRTRNGNFLTLDMVNAIVDNEVKFIKEHFDKFSHYGKHQAKIREEQRESRKQKETCDVECNKEEENVICGIDENSIVWFGPNKYGIVDRIENGNVIMSTIFKVGECGFTLTEGTEISVPIKSVRSIDDKEAQKITEKIYDYDNLKKKADALFTRDYFKGFTLLD